MLECCLVKNTDHEERVQAVFITSAWRVRQVTEGRVGHQGGVPVNKQFRTADKCVLSAWKLGEGRKMPYHNKPTRYDVLCTASDLDDALG
jgi:hypothetical protein